MGTSKWLMPHEMESAPELVAPAKAAPRFILPHEEQTKQEAVKSPEAEALAEETPLNRGLIGAGQRFNDIGLGAKQRAGQIRNLFPGEQSKWPEEVTNELKSQKPTREAIANDPYAGYGKAAADIGLSMLAPSAKLLPSMMTGAALEGISPMEEPTWGNVLTEGGKGALQGLAGSALMNGLVGTVARSKNALQGRFADPNAERRYRIFRQNDVPGSLGDITQDPAIMSLENMVQHVPYSGRRQFMEQQANRLGKVVEGAPEQIAGAVPTSTKEDIGKVLSNSIKTKYKSVKDTARTLYDDVEARVQQAGNPPITPTKMSAEVNGLLTKYPSVFAKLGDDPDTVNTLRTIATGVQPGRSPILGANGQPILTPPNLTFSELRQLDSDLGSMIRQGRQLSARGDLNNKSFDQLVRVQKALRDDMSDWSQTVGDPTIASGVANANKYFRETVVPFRKNTLTRKVLQDDQFDTDTLANSLFRLDSPTRTSQAVDFLTPDGVQAGRYHLLQQAKDKAMNAVLESGYSPSKFLRNTELGETGPKLFSPDELGQISDLQELVGSSRRAASYSADPMTGNRLLGMSPLLSMKIPLAAKAFSTATQSEAPMRFMLADPRLYTGDGALGKAGEALLRKSGAGVGVSYDEF
mgnify:CR=1 FL=1